MALNQAFILPPLQQQLWDKTLNVPLAGGFVHFFEDANRTIPKVVYELTGTGPGSYLYVSLGSVLTLSGIGTYVDAEGGNIPIYLWPFLGTPNDQPPSQTAQNYYITVYSSTGVFQFDIPNWPGVSTSVGPSDNTFDITDNIISNGQFVDVLFPTTATAGSPMTFSTTGTNTETTIAPDWSVITTGAGTISVWQIQIADDTAPGNPAWALGITSTGYPGNINIRQRLLTPRIFSNRYVSGTFIAQTTNGSYTINMNYTPSITGTVQQICTGTSNAAGYTVIANSTPILVTDPGSGTGYVDITIEVPVGAILNLSCIQLCGVTNSTEVVSYLEETPEREIDHLFHYFKPGLDYKPTNSFLIGWDFALNPSQFFANGIVAPVNTTVGNKSYYAWDQTILFQAQNNGLNVTRLAKDGSIQVTPAVDGQFAMIQYLIGNQARNLFVALTLSGLSAFIEVASENLRGNYTISLWWTINASLPNITANNSLVTALDADGHPTVVAGWTEIARSSVSESNKFANTVAGIIQQFGFSSFFSNAPEAAQASKFAIVIGTCALTAGDTVLFQSVSVVPGSVPTRPAIQAPDEVLRECRYYYQKSFLTDITPATAKIVGNGEYYSIQNRGGISATGYFTGINFPVPMITIPAITLYSPVIADTNVYNFSTASPWTVSTPSAVSTNGFFITGTTPGGAIGDLVGIQWTANALLGTF